MPSILGYNVDDFIKKVGSPKKNEDIDHKIPISWFKKETPISIIWNLENLQIIDSSINRSKSNHHYHPITENYKETIKEMKDNPKFTIGGLSKGYVFSLLGAAIFGLILAAIMKSKTNPLNE